MQRFTGGPDLPFLFALSGTADPFRLYLEAAGAELGHRAVPTFLPFNTLHQHLTLPPDDTPVVYLVLPWDLVPETDWRSGVPQARVEVARALDGHAGRRAPSADVRGRVCSISPPPFHRWSAMPRARRPSATDWTPSQRTWARTGCQPSALRSEATSLPDARSVGRGLERWPGAPWVPSSRRSARPPKCW